MKTINNVFLSNKNIVTLIFGLWLLLSSAMVFAEAGRVIFAYGDVTAEGENGIVRHLSKRSYVEVGDTIKTSNNAIVQMHMIDKAMIALRANTQFKIEEFHLGKTKEEDSGIFSLLRGGFRAVTGIIGKRLKRSYIMRTITATIGIRGTDYTARLCDNDCNSNFRDPSAGGTIANGLYVGVNEGGINVTNTLGTLSLDELQFGYVKDATTAPVALVSAPDFLYFNSKAPNPDEQASKEETQTPEEKRVTAFRATVEPASADLTSDDNIKQDLKAENIEADQEKIEENIIIDQVAVTETGNTFSLAAGSITSSRMVATSFGKQNNTGSLSTVSSNPFGSANVTSGHDVTQFTNNYLDNSSGVGIYTLGSSSTIDLGYDPTTGVAWGRWGAGFTQFQPTNGSATPDTSNLSSVHWIVSPDQSQQVALPSSGTASYALVGNTTPTDNLGNNGILGNATLDANFTNMTVDTSVAVGINGQVWNGSTTGLNIGSDGGFSGAMDTVTVNTGGNTVIGSGNTAGFITNNGVGAGMGFSLEANVNSVDTTVTGTAAFQK